MAMARLYAHRPGSARELTSLDEFFLFLCENSAVVL
jgi:hypothetical protein